MRASLARANSTRETRIDERPRILDVLRGEMSFVGPRPERPQFVEQLVESISRYRERRAVKPGITRLGGRFAISAGRH